MSSIILLIDDSETLIMLFPHFFESLSSDNLKILDGTFTIAIVTGILYYFGYLLELKNVDRYGKRRLFKGFFFVLTFVTTPCIGFHIFMRVTCFDFI